MRGFPDKGSGQDCRDHIAGLVVRNAAGEQRMLLQPPVGVWRQVRACHFPIYIGSEGPQTTAVAERRAEALEKYTPLTAAVELLVGGQLRHGSARLLSHGGWGLAIEADEEGVFLGV